ncbi:hypothetical protein WMF45_00465 [Sorangium sp. So ce448]|uniref:hypothetical protein n=1 Tax=Sorangium sp. So ce448 TaxID=3133314 RepID=UPI003F63DACF
MVSLAAYCSSSPGVVAPPVVELAVVELVALPPPAPVVLLVVELAELLTEELAELLAEELAEALTEELAELLAVELAASSPPAPPRPPAPPVPSAPPEPDELLTVALVTSPAALDEPLVAEPVELLVADPMEPAPVEELGEGAPPELAEAPPPPPVFSPSRLEPWAHATSVRSEMAQSAVAPFGQELDRLTRLTRLPRLPSCGGAPALVDTFPREPQIRAAPEVIGPSSDAHLAIGRILNTPATARPSRTPNGRKLRSTAYREPPGISKRLAMGTFR